MSHAGTVPGSMPRHVGGCSSSRSQSPCGHPAAVEAAEIERLQNTLDGQGRLSLPLNPHAPPLPEDKEWICAPSTFRLRVMEEKLPRGEQTLLEESLIEKDRIEFRKTQAQERLERAGRLQLLLQSDRNRDRDDSTTIRCFAQFQCTSCVRSFRKNT